MNVSFLGLGIMGSRMAGNLLKGDVNLTVFNRSQAPIQELVKAGASAAASWEDAVRNADIVFTMLATPEAVAETALSEDGFLSAMKENALWVDCSTVNPSFSLKEAAAAAEHNVRFVDAPVAGSKGVAESGSLVFLAGGSEKDLKEVQSLLDIMGSKTIHPGYIGKGTSLKMLVNALLAQSMLVFSETVLLGEKLGLSRDFLLDTLPNLPVTAPFTKAKAEMMRKDQYEVQFPLELMHKDLHLAALTAYENNLPFYSVNMAKEIFAGAKKSGLGRNDFSAVFKYLEK